MVCAIRRATAEELAAMTLLDIMSNSEPEETHRSVRGGHAASRYTQVRCDIMHRIQTICIYDNTSSFLDNDGGGSDVPAVHPNVIVSIGATCRHLTHVNCRCPQCTDTGTYKKHANNTLQRSQHTELKANPWDNEKDTN